MFCIPIEKKPETCVNCIAHDYESWPKGQMEPGVICNVTGDMSTNICPAERNCPIVPMPDVEGLKAERDLYRGLIDEIILDDCSSPERDCLGSEVSCQACWCIYLESKLKESEELK